MSMCRVFAEVAFEALPQVVLQVLAISLLPDSPYRPLGPLSVKAIIGLSFPFTFIMLLKQVALMYSQAKGLHLTLWQYIKCVTSHMHTVEYFVRVCLARALSHVRV